MKRTFILIITIVVTAIGAMAQKGEKTLGILAGYTTENQSALTGLYFKYRINNMFRLSPDCQFAIKHNDRSAFMFNGNLHIIFQTSAKTNLYPLIGITYQNWNFSDIDGHHNHFGGNIGAGFEVKATPTLVFSIEGKYSFIKDFSSGNIYAGIGYLF